MCTFLGYHHEIVPYTCLMSIRAGGGYPPWVYFLSYGRGLYVDIFLILSLFLCKYNIFLLFLTFPLHSELICDILWAFREGCRDCPAARWCGCEDMTVARNDEQGAQHVALSASGQPVVGCETMTTQQSQTSQRVGEATSNCLRLFAAP